MVHDLSIRLDRSIEVPLYQQIADAVRVEIRAGRLSHGAKLPATRTIAKELGVHRKTVVQAFDLLANEGLLTAGVGQGTFVRGDRSVSPREERKEPATNAHGSDEVGFSWDELMRARPEPSPVWRFLHRNRPDPEWIRFTGATADPSHFPAEEFRECVNEVLREQGASALDFARRTRAAP
ncbi:MAG: GntR family transcriptional regulator [Candidatus Eisenbacteria bacterium]